MGSFSDWKVRGVSGSELDRSAEWGNRMKADLAEARAEIARLEIDAATWRGSFDGMVAVERELKAELAECREELAGAVLIGREDRLRATEAERALKDLLTRGEKLMVPRYSAGSDMDQFIAAWNRAKSALDTQAREGE